MAIRAPVHLINGNGWPLGARNLPEITVTARGRNPVRLLIAYLAQSGHSIACHCARAHVSSCVHAPLNTPRLRGDLQVER